MSEVLQANIFFFITGVAVIVFTALLCVALFHVIKVIKSLRRIMERIEAGTEVIAEDLEQVHAFFTQEGFIGKIITSVMGSQKRQRSPRAKQEKRTNALHNKDEV